MKIFKGNNRIIPVHDFDLIIELNVEKLSINATHPDYIGGFIFKHITFKISEFTLDDEDKTIYHKTLDVIKISKDGYPFIRTKRLHFKVNRVYEFNFFDDVSQRVINNNDEKYDVDIDYRLRFYYTTDKDRDFDAHYVLK